MKRQLKESDFLGHPNGNKTNAERIKEAEQTVKDLNVLLVGKRKIFLEIEVLTEEAADEIWQWMYNKEKPMKSTLLQVAWNQTLVPIKVGEAIKIIQENLNG